MRNVLFSVLCLFVTTSFGSQQSFKVPVQGSITLHIQNNAVQAINLADRLPASQQAYQAVQNRIVRVSAWCSNNPIKLLLGSVALSYGIIWGYFRYLEIKDDSHDNWSDWKSAVPLAILQEVPTDDFMSELSLDVAQRYQNIDPWDAWNKLIININGYELIYQRALLVMRAISSLHLSFLFKNVHEKIDFCEQRLQRLALIKKRVTSFLSTYLPPFAKIKTL